MKIITPWTKREKKNLKPLIRKNPTVPDMAYSVAELLKRIMTGQALPNEYVKKEGIYYDDMDHDSVDIEQFQKMDQGLKQKIVDDAAETAKKAKNDLEKVKEDKARKRAEKKQALQNETQTAPQSRQQGQTPDGTQIQKA